MQEKQTPSIVNGTLHSSLNNLAQGIELNILCYLYERLRNDSTLNIISNIIITIIITIITIIIITIIILLCNLSNALAALDRL